MQSPLLGVVNQCVDTITKLTREFGLTPAARSRIFVNPPEDDGSAELWQLLSQPRAKREAFKDSMGNTESAPRQSFGSFLAIMDGRIPS